MKRIINENAYGNEKDSENRNENEYENERDDENKKRM